MNHNSGMKDSFKESFFFISTVLKYLCIDSLGGIANQGHSYQYFELATQFYTVNSNRCTQRDSTHVYIMYSLW